MARTPRPHPPSAIAPPSEPVNNGPVRRLRRLDGGGGTLYASRLDRNWRRERMQSFARPSDMFRWALREFDTGDESLNLRACFPQYWAQRDSDGYLWRQYDRRLAALVRNATRGRRILEVGSGFGIDTTWASISGAEVVGIDVKSSFVEFGRALADRIAGEFGRPLPIAFQRSNLLAIDAGSYDFVFMKDVFHHLEPRSEMVAQIARVLRPGGELLIVEPNALNPLIQWQMFRIRGFRTIIEKRDARTGEVFLYGNERLVTGEAMRKAFAAVGVEGRVERFRLLPTALSVHPSLTRFAERLETLGLDRLVPPACVHTLFHGVRRA